MFSEWKENTNTVNLFWKHLLCRSTYLAGRLTQKLWQNVFKSCVIMEDYDDYCCFPNSSSHTSNKNGTFPGKYYHVPTNFIVSNPTVFCPATDIHGVTVEEGGQWSDQAIYATRYDMFCIPLDIKHKSVLVIHALCKTTDNNITLTIYLVYLWTNDQCVQGKIFSKKHSVFALHKFGRPCF